MFKVSQDRNYTRQPPLAEPWVQGLDCWAVLLWKRQRVIGIFFFQNSSSAPTSCTPMLQPQDKRREFLAEVSPFLHGFQDHCLGPTTMIWLSGSNAADTVLTGMAGQADGEKETGFCQHSVHSAALPVCTDLSYLLGWSSASTWNFSFLKCIMINSL